MEQLLTTKLYIPPVRKELVPRSRLIEKMNEGLERKLTLVCAPAGFGKTSLVSDWVDNLSVNHKSGGYIKINFAWLSLDENDNDPARFMAYVIAALQTVDADIAPGEIAALQSNQPPQIETMLTSLINNIAVRPDRLILILDDYHLIESQPIHDALNFLLENLPPQMHLVIATREDPLLPLSRLRARAQLTELRAADLRFTSSEVAQFFNRVMGFKLSSTDIAALERRTEGWIAGLQLAAISLQGKKNTSQLIKSFSGSYRLVLDYLIEEVLEQQPRAVQTFLLQTSILNRLTGSLCKAVTGQDNSQQVLELLDRTNLFVVPLDEERLWYRYHHLFADLLRQRLNQKLPEQISKLHQLASEWYEQRRLWSDALHHAFAIDDNERAADLIELAWPSMNTNYQSVTWLGWAKTLPVDLVRSRPALCTACGWASLDNGDLEAAESHFQDGERWLGLWESTAGTSPGEPDRIPEERSLAREMIDREEFRSLSISIANGRAYLAQAHGDVIGTKKYARQATGLLLENEYFERGLSEILIGFAQWANGDLVTAYEAVSEAISTMRADGKTQFIISFTSYLADIMISLGRLKETERTYLQLLDTVTGQGESHVREKAVLHLGLSELYFEQGNMEAAMRHLERSEELGDLRAFPPWYRRWINAHAQARMSLGNLEGVIEMFSSAERLYYRHPIPDVRPLRALLAQARLAQGDLTGAQHWAQEQGLSVDDDLRFLREFDHITLAKLLIAQYKNDRTEVSILDAIGLLERLLKAAEEGERLGSVIQILVLQALALEAQDKLSDALEPLERALTLAEPEGYFRIFVDEGPPMARLLYAALSHEISPEYVQRLLSAFTTTDAKKAELYSTHSPEFGLIEPLSERELEILQLIAQGLTNKNVGGKLYLSLNTVKAHTRNIYGKLGVNSRTQAAARARALGLLLAPE